MSEGDQADHQSALHRQPLVLDMHQHTCAADTERMIRPRRLDGSLAARGGHRAEVDQRSLGLSLSYNLLFWAQALRPPLHDAIVRPTHEANISSV